MGGTYLVWELTWYVAFAPDQSSTLRTQREELPFYGNLLGTDLLGTEHVHGREIKSKADKVYRGHHVVESKPSSSSKCVCTVPSRFPYQVSSFLCVLRIELWSGANNSRFIPLNTLGRTYLVWKLTLYVTRIWTRNKEPSS